MIKLRIFLGMLLLSNAASAANISIPVQPKDSRGRVRAEISKPSGDPLTAPSPSNQFVFSGPDGIATVPVQASVNPGRLAANISDQIKWTFESLPPGVKISWDHSWPGDPTSGQGINATATLTGYPSNNGDFGLRTLKMVRVRKSDNKVFNQRSAKIALFFSHNDQATGRNAPNWFYYWNQSGAGDPNAIWDSTLNNPGRTPAMRLWSTYSGPRRRLLIGPGSDGSYTRRDGSGLTASGIGMFANVVLHERRHVQQIFDNNSSPFYSGKTGLLRDAAAAGWSFNEPQLPGSLWNHFTDKDGDGIYNVPPDLDLDTEPDDIADAIGISAADMGLCATPIDHIECQAQLAETSPDQTFSAVDWSDVGKQHY